MTEQTVEAVARAICRADGDCPCEVSCHKPGDIFYEMAQAALAAARPLIMAEAAGEFETRFWSIVDPNSVPSDMWNALERMASAYRKVAAAQAIRHAATPADPHEEQGR